MGGSEDELQAAAVPIPEQASPAPGQPPGSCGEVGKLLCVTRNN